MEGRSYVSCIKINGVPILPPMMTKARKEEMSYYKQLAVAVENKLAALRSLKQPNGTSEVNATRRESYEVRVKERLYDLDNDLADSNISSLDLDASPSVSTIVQLPPKNTKDLRLSDPSTRDTSVALIKYSGHALRKRSCDTLQQYSKNAIKVEPFDALGNLSSNTLTKECSTASVKNSNVNSEEENLEDESSSATRVVSRSDSLATSADLSQGLTGSASSNTTPEAWKPQVPKTLNVIPLTLPSPNSRTDAKYAETANSFKYVVPTPPSNSSSKIDVKYSEMSKSLNVVPAISSRANSMIDAKYSEMSRSLDVDPTTISSSNSTIAAKYFGMSKSLDIVPMTIASPNSTIEEKYSEIEMESPKEAPKLVRQGSYVLDSPSPMLLAHMQTEFANSPQSPYDDYVPTNATNGAKRREWNIAQAKVEWEQQYKDVDDRGFSCHVRNQNEIISEPTTDRFGRYFKNNECNVGYEHNFVKERNFGIEENFPTERNFAKDCSGICNTVPQRKRCQSRFGAHQSTRSVDCIQAILAKEYISKNNARNSEERRTVKPAEEKSQRFERRRRRGNFSILNFAQKLGGSLGNLNTIAVPFHKCMEGDGEERGSVREDLNEKIVEDESGDPTCKPRTSGTTNKLLTVYKEIEKMHKRQMAELVSRQQKEQNLLEKEFEKQQVLLLTEIKKSFPEMTLPLLSENVPCHAFPENQRQLGNFDIENGNDLPQNFHRSKEEYSQDIRNKNEVPVCPLDFIYPRDVQEVSRSHIRCSQSTQTLLQESPENLELRSSRETLSENLELRSSRETRDYEGKSEGTKCNGEQKRSSVSRRLFPLDGKTIHVPILDGTPYEAKHIRAANVISAYARGYLVRRLMKTERVVELKNTYREALHCMIKLHVDAPLDRSEFNFLHRLQLQCDAASMNIAELFGLGPGKRMEVIAQDREVKRSRAERPTSARSYSFATQRTLARKKLKEMGDYRPPSLSRSSSSSRSRCQTWTSDVKEKLISPKVLHQSIKRSTSAGTVRKPWR